MTRSTGKKSKTSRNLPQWVGRRLDIDDERRIEIESKRRVIPEDVATLKTAIERQKGVRHIKTALFFDQYLDTPGLDLLQAGASLRLRYKGSGARVYLQYKGPGFYQDGILYRSEFSTTALKNVLREESHHDLVHFTRTSVTDILKRQSDTAMADAMRRHLGSKVIARVSQGPIICSYRKDKYCVALEGAFLEPSVDHVSAFHVGAGGLHSLSTFFEYENEIKSHGGDIRKKLARVDELLAFDLKISAGLNMPSERMDKYRRCASCFLPKSSARSVRGGRRRTRAK